VVHETGRATKELLHGRCTTGLCNEEYRPETDPNVIKLRINILTIKELFFYF
jgi:hypothetical protein